MSTNFKTIIKMLQQDLDALNTEQAEINTKREAIEKAISSLELQTANKQPEQAAAPAKRRRPKRKHFVQIPADIHRMVALYHIARKQPVTTAEIARIYSAPYSGRMNKKVYTYVQKAQLTAMKTLTKEGIVFQRSGGAYSYTLTQKGVELLRDEQMHRDAAESVLFLEKRLSEVAAPATA